jgi:hypothetical protein
MALRMDQALMLAAAVFFGLITVVLWVNNLCRSRKAKGEAREVGYLRPEIEINATAVPEFKPTWRDVRDKGEAR